jgi:hypothetical protein
MVQRLEKSPNAIPHPAPPYGDLKLPSNSLVSPQQCSRNKKKKKSIIYPRRRLLSLQKKDVKPMSIAKNISTLISLDTGRSHHTKGYKMLHSVSSSKTVD